jgi:hypothetical protein
MITLRTGSSLRLSGEHSKMRMSNVNMKPFTAAPVPMRRAALVCRASSSVQSVALPLKGLDGSERESELKVKVASPASARGLVHRYLVMVQQNARRVRTQFVRSAPQKVLFF